MRNYLYIWHDVEQQAVIASGIEFKDFLSCLSNQGGLLLVEHHSDVAEHDQQSGFACVNAAAFTDLAAEDIYSWGNFVWADFASSELPVVPDTEVAELLFFAHKANPLKEMSIPSLKNCFLAYAHDDGWYLKLYYSSWIFIEQFIANSVASSLGPLNAAELKLGGQGFWVSGGMVSFEEKTEDIDAVLNRRFKIDQHPR